MDTNLYFLPALCTEAMLLKHVFVLATSSMIFVKLQKMQNAHFGSSFSSAYLQDFCLFKMIVRLRCIIPKTCPHRSPKVLAEKDSYYRIFE